MPPRDKPKQAVRGALSGLWGRLGALQGAKDSCWPCRLSGHPCRLPGGPGGAAQLGLGSYRNRHLLGRQAKGMDLAEIQRANGSSTRCPKADPEGIARCSRRLCRGGTPSLPAAAR